MGYGARIAMQRKAGAVLPLFSIRTRRDWGIGQITDLPVCAAWLRRAGQRLLQILPAARAVAGETSPYGALTAFGLDPIYVDVEAVEDLDARSIAGALGDEGAALARARPRGSARRLRRGALAQDARPARGVRPLPRARVVARDAARPAPGGVHPARARVAGRSRPLRDAARVARRLGLDDVARGASAIAATRALDEAASARRPSHPRGRVRAVDAARAVGRGAGAHAASSASSSWATCRSSCAARAPTCGRTPRSSSCTCRSARRPTPTRRTGRTGGFPRTTGSRWRPTTSRGSARARATRRASTTASGSTTSSATSASG